MSKILNLCSKAVEFKVCVVDSRLFHSLKEQFIRVPDWEMRLNVCFWFLSLKHLKVLPNKILMDFLYTDTKKQKYVEYLLTSLATTSLGKSPYFQAMPSYEESCIKVSDIIAGILRKRKSLRRKYSRNIKRLTKEECLETMKMIRHIRM